MAGYLHIHVSIFDIMHVMLVNQSAMNFTPTKLVTGCQSANWLELFAKKLEVYISAINGSAM